MRIVPYGPGIARLKVEARNFLTDIAEEVRADAVRLAPVDTGYLKSSIARYSAGPLTERIHAFAPYAAYVELGTKPHGIKPRNKKALWWEGAEHPYARVWHPGATEQPYLRTALFKRRGPR